MKVVQLNLNHYAAAQDLLSQTTREYGVELAALSEPYRVGSSPNWAADTTGKATLWTCGAGATRLSHVLASNGFVRGMVGNWWVYSVYLAPSLSLPAFCDRVDRLASDARGLAMLDVARLNTGDQHTFSRAGVGSVVDLTFVSGSKASQCTWELSKVYTASDHAAIFSDLAPHLPLPLRPLLRPARSYKADTLDVQRFSEGMEGLTISGAAEQMTEDVMQQLHAVCGDCMQSRRPHSRHRENRWNRSIADARSDCVRARRRYQRSYGTPSFLDKRLEYQACRRALKA
ncbi:hypothetical protein KR054_005197, partial [Drosophila jambulina]